MAAATTVCSTGAAAATGRGSIDTAGAGGGRCPVAPRPRPRRRFGRRTRGRRSAMGELLSRTRGTQGPETGRRTGTVPARETPTGSRRQQGLGGWLLLTAASPPASSTSHRQAQPIAFLNEGSGAADGLPGGKRQAVSGLGL